MQSSPYLCVLGSYCKVDRRGIYSTDTYVADLEKATLLLDKPNLTLSTYPVRPSP